MVFKKLPYSSFVANPYCWSAFACCCDVPPLLKCVELLWLGAAVVVWLRAYDCGGRIVLKKCMNWIRNSNTMKVWHTILLPWLYCHHFPSDLSPIRMWPPPVIIVFVFQIPGQLPATSYTVYTHNISPYLIWISQRGGIGPIQLEWTESADSHSSGTYFSKFSNTRTFFSHKIPIKLKKTMLIGFVVNCYWKWYNV